MSVNIYADIVALFQKIGDGVINQIMASIGSVLTGKVMGSLYIVIIIIWLIKKKHKRGICFNGEIWEK